MKHKTVKEVYEIEEWKQTTCGKASKLLTQGFTVWWRPTGKLSKDNPDNDVALYR